MVLNTGRRKVTPTTTTTTNHHHNRGSASPPSYYCYYYHHYRCWKRLQLYVLLLLLLFTSTVIIRYWQVSSLLLLPHPNGLHHHRGSGLGRGKSTTIMKTMMLIKGSTSSSSSYCRSQQTFRRTRTTTRASCSSFLMLSPSGENYNNNNNPFEGSRLVTNSSNRRRTILTRESQLLVQQQRKWMSHGRGSSSSSLTTTTSLSLVGTCDLPSSSSLSLSSRWTKRDQKNNNNYDQKSFMSTISRPAVTTATTMVEEDPNSSGSTNATTTTTTTTATMTLTPPAAAVTTKGKLFFAVPIGGNEKKLPSRPPPPPPPSPVASNLSPEPVGGVVVVPTSEATATTVVGKEDVNDSNNESDTTTSSLSSSSSIAEEEKEEELLLEGLSSQPVEKWDRSRPLDWTNNFGRRSKEYDGRLAIIAHLQPGDDGYYDVSDSDKKIDPKEVTIVRTKEQAQIVMNALMNADPSIFHACDTEVMDIDLSEVGPVGNGYVTCVSVYSGPDFDYGFGNKGTTLWIDNLDDAYGIIQEFKPWFEDERFLKVWHNYGFDRHVMWNEGIDCQGFGGDTMHMARLQDTSRSRGGGGGYSLESLTEEMLLVRKRPMKELFGVPRIRKDGTPGSLVDVPPVEVLQRDPTFRPAFIQYSSYDAKGTWRLHERLVELLTGMKWLYDGSNMYDYYWANMREFGVVLTNMERRGIRVDAKDYLASVEVQARQDREEHSRIFREWAAKMIGVDGLVLNPASSTQLGTFLFGGAENSKTRQRTEKERVFKVGREEFAPEVFGEYKKRVEDEKIRQQGGGNGNSISNNSVTEDTSDQLDLMKAAQLKALCKDYGLKVSGKKDDLKARLREYLLSSPNEEQQKEERAQSDHLDQLSDDELRDAIRARCLNDDGDREDLLKRFREDIEFMQELKVGHTSIAEALDARGGLTQEILDSMKDKTKEESKFIEVTIRSLGMAPIKYTAGGAPSVTADVLRELAGHPFEDPPKYGSAYEYFGGGEQGHDACVALYSLCAIGSIDTMIANFLTSLQTLADHQSRVHCSLNLNTETGRLSSRRPNLQNQPALEKDKYKIRKAFQSSPGNSLIVADYGQLELRLLASMTYCKSMIDAFAAGGDFHSRTALDMFDYVKQKVDDGEVLLEWDYANGAPPKPLLKDAFASERRKAKTLNFSIAYGKTAHGLSKDWGVTQSEAQEMLDKWYDARPEVRKWQAQTKNYALKTGITRTLMGRYRHLPEAFSGNMRLMGHVERASINTPIQGGAADVAMMAMNKIDRDERLKSLGWILLMQIHDEVILEGPEETARAAFDIVIECMENPWVKGLDKTSVPLLVDGSYEHKTWYDAK